MLYPVSELIKDMYGLSMNIHTALSPKYSNQILWMQLLNLLLVNMAKTALLILLIFEFTETEAPRRVGDAC